MLRAAMRAMLVVGAASAQSPSYSSNTTLWSISDASPHCAEISIPTDSVLTAMTFDLTLHVGNCSAAQSAGCHDHCYVKPAGTAPLKVSGVGVVTAQLFDLAPSPRPTANPPNLLWVMADDMGVGELGGSNPASPIRTPHLDQLAADGLRFTAAYAGYTVCAPSRATLFTGRSIGRIAGAPGPKGDRWPVLPALLQQAGYETAIFGKSAPMDTFTTKGEENELAWGSPLDYGFETFLGQDSQLYCHNMYPLYIKNGSIASGGAAKLELPRNAKAKSRELCMAKPEDYDYTTDLFADNALGWLKRRTAPRPFFLYVSFTVPHAGGWGSAPNAPEDGAPVPKDMGYTNTSWPEVERDHAASVAYMDARIGELLATLDDGGLARKTVVFFASDNGPHNEGGHHVDYFQSSGGLQGYKRSFYEGGMRSPSIIRWSGTITPGVSDYPWAFWDVLPTMLDLAGAPSPPGAGFDGHSIVPTLMGSTQPPPKYMYWTWRLDSNPFNSTDPQQTAASLAADPTKVITPGYSVRVGGWKAIVKHCADATGLRPSMKDKMELYLLESDPTEAHDVAYDRPDVVTMIRNLITSYATSPGLSCRCYQCGANPQVPGEPVGRVATVE